MSELTPPPTDKEGGRDWSVLGGEPLPDQNLVRNIQLDKGDVARFMGDVARQRFLAVEATTAAFVLSHAVSEKSSDLAVAVHRQAAEASMPDSDRLVEELMRIVYEATANGLGQPPIVEVLTQMHDVQVINDDTYWRAMAIVAHLYELQKPPADSPAAST